MAWSRSGSQEKAAAGPLQIGGDPTHVAQTNAISRSLLTADLHTPWKGD